MVTIKIQQIVCLVPQSSIFVSKIKSDRQENKKHQIISSECNVQGC